MAEQMVVDVALPFEDYHDLGEMAHLIHFLQEPYAILGPESILQQSRKPSFEAWAPVKQRQKDQDRA